MTMVATPATQTELESFSALGAAPLPVIIEDFSAVAAFCDEQREAQVTDLGAVLAEPGVLGELLSKVVVVAVNDAALDACGARDRDALLGSYSAQLMLFTNPEAFVDQVLAVFENRDRVRSELGTADGGDYPIERVVNWSVGSSDGFPDYSKVLVIVEESPTDASLEMGQLAHSEQLEALIEIGGQLTSMLEPDVIFEKVLQTIEDSLHPTQAAILLLDLDEEAVVETAGAIHSDVEERDFDLIMGGLCGTAIRSGVALISDDVSKERGFKEPALTHAAGMSDWSQIAAPIVSSGTAIGAINLLFAPGRPKPLPEAASYIATLAGQVAVAISNADVYAELAEGHAALQAAHKQLQDTQTQLLSAQKMEAIGSLAAGIAHEINTPIQYVSDNVSFLSDASKTTGLLLNKVSGIMERLEARGESQAAEEFRKAIVDADWEFIVEEVPDAFEQTMEGVERVASIVRAMKEFAHPGTDEKAPIDINRCIETTIEVAKNEWKYIADIELQLDPEMPHVPALTGPFNQTLLILIVNAAQALGEFPDSFPGEKGQITISTATEGDEAIVAITDNGPGIPPSISDQIFDPFFTTKDVGKGSGQGLSIAHSVIVERHGGTIHVESELDEGASFVLRLPLHD